MYYDKNNDIKNKIIFFEKIKEINFNEKINLKISQLFDKINVKIKDNKLIEKKEFIISNKEKIIIFLEKELSNLFNIKDKNKNINI